jgi:IS30 family transposase
MAIKLRDNHDDYNNQELKQVVRQLAEKDMFSLRQIGLLCRKSPSTIGRLVARSSKTGGRFNPKHLEMMRDLVFEKDLGQIDWHKVSKIASGGTSIDVIARFSGISKSTIHRKLNVGQL